MLWVEGEVQRGYLQTLGIPLSSTAFTSRPSVTDLSIAVWYWNGTFGLSYVAKRWVHGWIIYGHAVYISETVVEWQTFSGCLVNPCAVYWKRGPLWYAVMNDFREAPGSWKVSMSREKQGPSGLKYVMVCILKLGIVFNSRAIRLNSEIHASFEM